MDFSRTNCNEHIVFVGYNTIICYVHIVYNEILAYIQYKYSAVEHLENEQFSFILCKQSTWNRGGHDRKSDFF